MNGSLSKHTFQYCAKFLAIKKNCRNKKYKRKHKLIRNLSIIIVEIKYKTYTDKD